MDTPLKFWNELHDRYANTDWINQPSLFAQWVVQYFPQQGNILELGAGSGQDSRFFASKGYHVVSTDLSDRGLHYNQQKIPQELQLKVTIQQLNLENLFPLADESFDIVYSHLAIHYFDNKIIRQIFDEIYRVLKPGGIVALFTNSTSDPEYNTGEKLEEDYFLLNSQVKKRFFSPQSIQKFGKKFEVIVADNEGETYKDRRIGVEHLIRFVGRKFNV